METEVSAVPAASATASYRPYYVEFRGQIEVCSPLHIGAGEDLSLHSDMPILRDPESGRPFIPGSSLRGVLRSHLEHERTLLGCSKSVLESLFGHIGPKHHDDALTFMGRLTVWDALWEDKTQSETCEIRDYVTIDPETGASARGKKFDAESLLRTGARFSFRLIYEGDGEKDRELMLLHEALDALKEGRLRVGAKSGWGFGQVCLAPGSLEYRSYQRQETKGLSEFLAMRFPSPEDDGWRQESFPWQNVGEPLAEPFDPKQPSPLSFLEFDLRVQCEGPVLVKSAIPPLMEPLDEAERGELERKLKGDPDRWSEMGLREADHVFLLSSTDEKPYLPGSSLRGVLRSQALRICRSQLTGDEPLEQLFGVQKGDGTGQKGCIEIGDGVLEGEPNYVYLDHVAIDRITGAAEDKKKFSTCGLDSPAFKVKVRLSIAPHQIASAALFAFLLRDLMNPGRLWVGSGTSRGYGMVQQTAIQELHVNLVARDWDGVEGERQQGRVKKTMKASGPKGLDWDELKWLWELLDSAWQRVRLREVPA